MTVSTLTHNYIFNDIRKACDKLESIIQYIYSSKGLGKQSKEYLTLL
jgi:hypothetical protein